jgi:hypothetical protein
VDYGHPLTLAPRELLSDTSMSVVASIVPPRADFRGSVVAAPSLVGMLGADAGAA